MLDKARKIFAAALAAAALLAATPVPAQIIAQNTVAAVMPAKALAPQTNSFLARLATRQTPQRAAQYNASIVYLLNTANYYKLGFLHFYAAQEQATGNTNLVSSSYTATPSGSPTWTANVGYVATSNNANYVETNYNVSTDPLWAQNQAMFFGWNTAMGATTNLAAIMGTAGCGTGSSYMLPLFTDTKTYWRANASVDDAPTLGISAVNFWGASRYASNGETLYAGAAQVRASAQVSAAPANATFRVLIDACGDTGTNTIAAAGAGQGWTTQAASDAGMAQIYQALRQYLVPVAGVP